MVGRTLSLGFIYLPSSSLCQLTDTGPCKNIHSVMAESTWQIKSSVPPGKFINLTPQDSVPFSSGAFVKL